MKSVSSIPQLPRKPAVYAMLGGHGSSAYVAYVGIAGDLRQRILQHLVRRDSSVTTGVSAASLNPDLITAVRWWEHSRFKKAEGREAAELVAFEILNPALRSRGGVSKRGAILAEEGEFRAEMEALFSGEATGVHVLPTLQDALARIEELERRVDELDRRIGGN